MSHRSEHSVLSEEEKKLRARGYRKKYNEKQASKQKEIERQIQAVQQDIHIINRLNHEEVLRETAIQGMHSYCDSAIQVLKNAACTTTDSDPSSPVHSTTISETLIHTEHSLQDWSLSPPPSHHDHTPTVSETLIHTAHSLQEWARHQYAMFPSFIEFLFGKLWTPTDGQMKWIIAHTKSTDFSKNHITFLNRTETLLNELKKYPESKNAIESKIQVVLNVWVRFTEILATERRDVLQDYAVIPQLKKFFESYQSSLISSHSHSSSGIIIPRTSSPDPIEKIAALSIELSDEQMYRLKEIWHDFDSTIRECRVNLGYDVSNVGTMKTIGAGTKARAEEYFLVLDVLEGSQEYVRGQASALITLFVEFIKLMKPLQLAEVLVQCKPLMPQLPFVCTSLLHRFKGDFLVVD